MTPNTLRFPRCSKLRDLLVILFFLIATVSSDNKYEGCFKDNPNRVLDGYFAYLPGLTTEMCIHICRNHNFAYAGVEYAQNCCCGNTLPTTPIDEHFCNATCGGDPTETCGGTWAVGVYDTTSYTPVRPKRSIPVKTIAAVTTTGVVVLCVTVLFLTGFIINHTPQEYPSFRDVYTTSNRTWSMILSALVLSLATIIAAVCADSVVIQVHDLGHWGKIKGSIIAVVGTLLHVLIGNVVTTRFAFIVVWWLMIYPRKVKFSLLYNTLAGMGWTTIKYSLRPGERLVLLVWISFGVGSLIAPLITGVIFKDTWCTEVVSVNTSTASYWRQVGGGGNNSVVTGYFAAVMATGSIANKLDSPGIIYDKNTSGMIALRPLQNPETFRNASTVKGLDAVLTTTSCKLDLAQNATVASTDPAGNQIIQINYYDQSFNVSVNNGGPERFKWIYINSGQSSGKVHHVTTRVLSVINDFDYPRYLLVGDLQTDPGTELVVDIQPNSVFNLTVHWVISTCDVVSRPIIVTMSGDLLTLVHTTDTSDTVDNWWSIIATTDIGNGLAFAYQSMRPRSGAGADSPGLQQDLSLNYSFTETQCGGPQECVEQLHSKTFSSILQNTAIPLVYDPQTYQTEIRAMCPISIDVSTLLLTLGVIGVCYSILALVERIVMRVRRTCGPTTSILELFKRCSDLVVNSTNGLCAAGEPELLNRLGSREISANFQTTGLSREVHYSYVIGDRSVETSDLRGDERVRGISSYIVQEQSDRRFS